MDPDEATRLNRALTKLSKAVQATKAHQLTALGLHPGQDVLLVVLAEADGMTISALAERLGVEPPTATRSLSRMEDAGLFRREAVPTDRRAVRIVLTDRGRALVPEIERVWTNLARAAVGRLARDEAHGLADTLERVTHGLADATPPHRTPD